MKHYIARNTLSCLPIKEPWCSQDDMNLLHAKPFLLSHHPFELESKEEASQSGPTLSYLKWEGKELVILL